MKKLKNTLTKTLILFLINLSVAQQIPNSGFEETFIWESNNELEPLNWIPVTYFGIVNQDCIFTLASKIIKESNNGMYAIEMKNEVMPVCSMGNMWPNGFTTATFDAFVPDGIALPYTERPEFLHFYHKFMPVGQDTAIAKISLFTWDEENGSLETLVASSSYYINTPSNVYTEITVPIEYYTNDTPEYIQVIFSSNAHQVDFPDDASIHGVTGNIGTTLIVDDISLSGGNLAIEEVDSLSIIIYPNPTKNTININTNTIINAIKIYDVLGKLVLEQQNNLQVINVSKLSSGLLFVKLETEQGVLVKKLIKE